MSELMTGAIREAEMVCGSITEAINIIQIKDNMNMEILPLAALAADMDIEVKHNRNTELIFMQLQDDIGQGYVSNKLYASDSNTVIISVGENLTNMRLLIIYKT